MIVLIGWMIIGIMGTVYASMRGGSFMKWLLIGVIGGPFGLVHAAVSCFRCPVCGKRVNSKAPMCPFCRVKMPGRKSAVDIRHCVIELALFTVIIGLIYAAMRMGYLKDALEELPYVNELVRQT
ncbi:MAG: hypothetical protein JXA07_00160 [Spirochaetes bacterium]|nr:hypothetical protein [Spirochaetota bacterium]